MTTTTRRATTNAADSTTWMEYGLCRQVDPAIFFPEGRGAAIAVQTEQAKQVCGGCPAKRQCLDWALNTGQHTGVWGGLSEDERRGLRDAPVGSQYLLCLSHQEFIEQRIAEGGTHQQVADELGVGDYSVGRAWRFFQSERRANEAEETVEVKAA